MKINPVEPEQVVAELQRTALGQNELARRLNVDPGRLSKLLHRSEMDGKILWRAFKMLRGLPDAR